MNNSSLFTLHFSLFFMLIDTHAHLYSEQFDRDREAMMERAFGAGVEQVYLPNVDSKTIDSMLALESAYPGRCIAMMGLHPCSVGVDYEAELKVVEDWLSRRSFCAVGEIGIDLYWDKTFFEEQKIAFARQMDWAKDLKIPIVIHSRESTEEILMLLREKKDYQEGGIFHCFGGSVEQAKEIIGLGFYLGIGGVLTFKKSGLDEVLKHVSLDHLVLETDAPYLAPTPFRGKRNESAYIALVAKRLAEVKDVGLDEVERITSLNAEKAFRVDSGFKI